MAQVGCLEVEVPGVRGGRERDMDGGRRGGGGGEVGEEFEDTGEELGLGKGLFLEGRLLGLEVGDGDWELGPGVEDFDGLG